MSKNKTKDSSLQANKKTVKSDNKTKIIKKIVKKNTRKKIVMEDLYSILNKVQMGGKKIIFAIELFECPVAENMIKDADIEYTKVEMKTQAVFTLFPKERKKIEDSLLDNLERYEDECPDMDLLFP